MTVRSAPLLRPLWRRLLVSLLGASELLLAANAAPARTAAIGLTAGAALLLVPWLPLPRTAALALLAVGTVPFAAATWWSLVTPLVAATALAIALPSLFGGDRRTGSAAPAPRRR